MDPMGRILGISLLLEADANENFVSLVRPDLYRVREMRRPYHAGHRTGVQ